MSAPNEIPSILDTQAVESPISGITALEPPTGYKYGDSFLDIVPIEGFGRSPIEGDERPPTARDQAIVVLKTQRDPIPAQMFDLPNRFCLTAEDFGITGDHKELAQMALAGDQDSFRTASRALYLFILLMKEDKMQREVVGLNGLPHRAFMGKDEKTQRGIYAPSRKYVASRWDVDSYSGLGVRSGMAPLEGFYQALAVAGWLTHILPNMHFAKSGANLTGFNVTEQARARADERLKADKSPKRKRAEAWLAAATKQVDSRLPKNEVPRGGKK